MFNTPVSLDECVLVFRGDDDSGWTAFVEHHGERVRLGRSVVPRVLSTLARMSANGEWVSLDSLAGRLDFRRVTLDVYLSRARAAPYDHGETEVSPWLSPAPARGHETPDSPVVFTTPRTALLRAGVADAHRVVEAVHGHRRLGVPSTGVRFEPAED